MKARDLSASKKYHSSFTSVEELFAREPEQFWVCAKALDRDLQMSQANNTQVAHSLKQSTIVFLEQKVSAEIFSMNR